MSSLMVVWSSLPGATSTARRRLASLMFVRRRVMPDHSLLFAPKRSALLVVVVVLARAQCIPATKTSAGVGWALWKEQERRRALLATPL